MEKDAANGHTDSDSAGQETIEVSPSHQGQATQESQDLAGEKSTVVDVGQDVSSSIPEISTTKGTTKKSGVLGFLTRIFTWAPPRCRYDPENPFKFNLALNLLFGLVSLNGLRNHTLALSTPYSLYSGANHSI